MADTPVDTLTEAEARDELARLATAMAEADALYAEAAPEITDAEYDVLKARNLAIETRFPALIREDSPSLKVGAPVSAQFSEVRHGVPMLSLDNAFDDDEGARSRLGEELRRLGHRAVSVNGADARRIRLTAHRSKHGAPPSACLSTGAALVCRLVYSIPIVNPTF